MAKQNINVGTAANDKKGDSLRAAFQKVNANFTELYTALGIAADADLNLGNFVFESNTVRLTNANNDDSTATQIEIAQPVRIESDLTVGGDVVPNTANGGDLGSAAKPWRSLYVSNNTIFIGGTAVGVDANGNLTTNGATLTSDRLVNGDYELVVETDGIISSVAFPERDGGKIYLSGVEIGAVPSDPADTFPYPLVLTSQQGNVRITSNAIQAPRLDWVFDTDGNLTLPGDIQSEGNINIEINLADSTLRRWSFGEDGNLETPGGVQVAGILKIDDGVHEQFQAKADATGVVTHDCSSGHIFYHTSPDANWTANFTNLNLSTTYATSITLIIAQGATGYYPSAVQIAGAAQTINWQGNVNPTVSTSRTDVVTFSVINNSGTYTVLGQLTGF